MLSKLDATRYDTTNPSQLTASFYLWRTDTKFKCPVDRLNLLCCDIRFRHRFSSLFHHQANGRVNSSSARALCGIGIVAYVVTFLVHILHLPLSRLYLASLAKASPIQTWPFAFTGHLRSRELEDLYKRWWVTWMEMIPDWRCGIWFTNKVHCSS